MRRDIVDTHQIKFTIDFSMVYPVLHLEIKEDCPLSLYKYLKNVLLEDTLITLGTLGFHVVFSIIPEGDEKLLKFQQNMGFEVESVENGMIILAQDTY